MYAMVLFKLWNITVMGIPKGVLLWLKEKCVNVTGDHFHHIFKS